MISFQFLLFSPKLFINNFIGIVNAATVQLDNTFDSDGYAYYDNAGANWWDNGLSIAVQDDGKYVVCGRSAPFAGTNDMSLWRVNADGKLDTTFSSDGYTSHHGAAGGNADDIGYSVAIQNDGKIIVAGLSDNASDDFDMTLWRYNTDGSLDTTFNSTGYVTHHNAAGGDGNDSPRLEVTKEKMRQSHLGKKRPDISKCLKGRKLSEKHIENLKGNQNAKGKNLRNQFAKEANIGNQHAKGLKWSEESKGKMKGNQNALGYKHSKEAKKRMQISQLKRRIREMEQGGLL